MSEEQGSCGQGIAAGAALPAKIAAVMATRGEVLERHTKALDAGDPAARAELEAYTALARAHREVADALARLAERMAACRDLPMGRHDEAVMADPDGQMEAFGRFVAAERELLALLEASLVEEEAMLG